MTRLVYQIYYRCITGGCSPSLSIIAGWTMEEVSVVLRAVFCHLLCTRSFDISIVFSTSLPQTGPMTQQQQEKSNN